MRPDTVETPALLDVRVRRAIACGIDSQAAVDALTNGKGIRTRTLTSPLVQYYPEIERAITKYDYDPRQVQRAMQDAGYAKGPDGFFDAPDGQNVQFSDASSAGDREEMELAVYVDGLRKAGFDASQRVVPVQQIRDPQMRALLPGLQLRGGAYQVGSYTSDQIPRSENRWSGDNRGGWSNADYPSERIMQLAQMEKILTEDVPIVPNMYSAYAVAVIAELQGPVARHTPLSGGPFLHIESWAWR
jgi:peptide/nickel transport system substrate-binding protein